jgi:hypothetical protein
MTNSLTYSTLFRGYISYIQAAVGFKNPFTKYFSAKWLRVRRVQEAFLVSLVRVQVTPGQLAGRTQEEMDRLTFPRI